MNLISHFFLDKDQQNSYFFVGISTPDLVSNFDRSLRLRQADVFQMSHLYVDEAERAFYRGMRRHFQVDGIFHDSTFFRKETSYLSLVLNKRFKAKGLTRSYFIAHLVLELILDRILIRNHDNLLFEFYRQFQKQDISHLVLLTEKAAKTQLPGYEDFLRRFTESQFMYRYVDMRYLLQVIRTLCRKVRIENTAYLNAPEFMELMYDYENRLSEIYEEAMLQLHQRLKFSTKL